MHPKCIPDAPKIAPGAPQIAPGYQKMHTQKNAHQILTKCTTGPPPNVPKMYPGTPETADFCTPNARTLHLSTNPRFSHSYHNQFLAH